MYHVATVSHSDRNNAGDSAEEWANNASKTLSVAFFCSTGQARHVVVGPSGEEVPWIGAMHFRVATALVSCLYFVTELKDTFWARRSFDLHIEVLQAASAAVVGTAVCSAVCSALGRGQFGCFVARLEHRTWLEANVEPADICC